LTATAAQSIWQEDLTSETRDFLVKLLNSTKLELDSNGELVRLMEQLPVVQRELASLYILTRAVERTIRGLMVAQRRRIFAEYEARQLSKLKPSGPRLHVHVGRDEDCCFCRQN